MKVVGLDPSATSTGVCVISPKEVDSALRTDVVWSSQALQIKEFTGLERAVRQVALLDEILSSTKPDLAVIEGYAYSARPHTLEVLVEVGTCLRLCLRRHGVLFKVVAPSQLKKFAGAAPVPRGTKGKARKQPMRDAVHRQWGFSHESDDVVDAYALAQMGLLMLGADPDRWTSVQLAMRKKFMPPRA